ncbi:MAG: hypothetical protein ACOYU3_05545 [Bacillota bacterium]
MRNLVKWIYIFMLAAILIAVAIGSCGKGAATPGPQNTAATSIR